ncbi:MAG: hypothetical protein ACK5MF_11545 [Vibrio sp.]|uniref:hypothetical protein n=1 Tax=Vibrio sp. TaxID=678 RepID=UPI003A8486AA
MTLTTLKIASFFEIKLQREIEWNKKVALNLTSLHNVQKLTQQRNDKQCHDGLGPWAGH